MAKTTATLPVYRVARTGDFDVTAPGDHVAWKKADWADLARFRAKGKNQKGHDYTARFKMLYSETGLYVLMDGTDRKLSATKTDDFEDLWTEDVFEFFLWPDEGRVTYFEYEISPLGRELALLVPNFGGHGKQYGWRPWHYEGDRRVRRKITIHGDETLKADGRLAPGATITGWTAEVFVPYKLLKPLQNVPPQPGTRWRANVYRCDYDERTTTAWFWSRTQSSFHDYARFGTLWFQ